MHILQVTPSCVSLVLSTRTIHLFPTSSHQWDASWATTAAFKLTDPEAKINMETPTSGDKIINIAPWQVDNWWWTAWVLCSWC